MNEANEFYQDMRTRHEAVLNWRDGSEATSNTGENADTRSVSRRSSVSGNGSANGEGRGPAGKDGSRSQPEKGVSLTPNG